MDLFKTKILAFAETLIAEIEQLPEVWIVLLDWEMNCDNPPCSESRREVVGVFSSEEDANQTKLARLDGQGKAVLENWDHMFSLIVWSIEKMPGSEVRKYLLESLN